MSMAMGSRPAYARDQANERSFACGKSCSTLRGESNSVHVLSTAICEDEPRKVCRVELFLCEFLFSEGEQRLPGVALASSPSKAGSGWLSGQALQPSLILWGL